MSRLLPLSGILCAILASSPSSIAPAQTVEPIEGGLPQPCEFVAVEDHPTVALLESLGCEHKQLTIVEIVKLRRVLAGLAIHAN